MELIQVYTTVDKREVADKISNVLVEKRLAACSQVFGPITSTYHWKEKVETSQEWVCILKTKKELFNELSEEIKHIHPYEVPEIIAIPITNGLPEYLQWIVDETK